MFCCLPAADNDTPDEVQDGSSGSGMPNWVSDDSNNGGDEVSTP
jgi:hypothetical protein